MNRPGSRRALMLSAIVLTLCTVALGGPRELEVLRYMPADFPLAVVVVDLEKFDGSVSAVRRRLDGQGAGSDLAGELRDDLPFGEWIDTSQPVGIASPSMGNEKEVILWVRVADFAAKIKGLNGAVEEDGIWQIPAGTEKQYFCKIQGDYVAASSSRERLMEATKNETGLAKVIAPRLEVLAGRDVLVRLNVEKLRPMIQQSLGQVAQMAPMMAMAAGQQGGDPAMMAGMVTALVQGVESFVKQLDYIEGSLGLTPVAADVTLFAGFSPGPIREYLSKQKAASMTAFEGLEEQPFFVAASYHFPGDSSPFMEYLFDKMARGVLEAPRMPQAGAPGAGESGQGGSKKDIKESLQVAKELYSRIAGQNVVMAFSSQGMRMAGNYLADEPQALLALVKKSLSGSNAVMEQFSAGAKYESLGATEIEGLKVEEFALKFDTTNPAGVMAGNLYGQDVRFGLAVAEGRVRFAMGGEEYLRRAFRPDGKKALTSSRYVGDALAALPERRNLVLLCDLAGMVPFLSAMGPMFGLPKVDSIPPGPPVGISATMSGEPARVDIHVPIRAIERVKQAFAPDEPM